MAANAATGSCRGNCTPQWSPWKQLWKLLEPNPLSAIFSTIATGCSIYTCAHCVDVHVYGIDVCKCVYMV